MKTETEETGLVYSDDLRVFTNDTDHFVARDAADASATAAAHYGGTADDFDPEQWEEVPAGKVLRIWRDVEAPALDECCTTWAVADVFSSRFPNGHHPECPVGSTPLPAKVWAERNGRGFLCSTES